MGEECPVEEPMLRKKYYCWKLYSVTKKNKILSFTGKWMDVSFTGKRS
jgi:hypothetical protein